MLTASEVSALIAAFPELDWIKPADWQSIAACYDWRSWIDDWKPIGTSLAISCILGLREQRIAIRKDCRDYFGADNVPNVNDPDDPTWA